MKILFDGTIFSLQTFGGVSNVMANLIYEISKRETVLLPMLGHNNHHLFAKGIFPKEKIESIRKNLNLPENGLNWGAINRAYVTDFLQKQDFDIFQPTHYDDYFIDVLKDRKKPFVFTIHDIISCKLIDYVPLQVKHLYEKDIAIQKKMCEAADKIIAISNHTKEDVVEHYGVKDDKITVIHNGCEMTPIVYHKLFDFPYILYVGTRCGYSMLNYKGFDLFFNQIAPFLREHAEIRLVCVGSEFTLQEKYLFKAYGLENKVISCRLNDEDINNAYHHSFCYVLPSLDEGFGLPVLEAYKNKCVALLNDIKPFREISGENGIFFNLSDGHSLEEKLNWVYNLTDDEKEQVIKRQESVLKNHTWAAAAEKYIQVYEETLNKK